MQELPASILVVSERLDRWFSSPEALAELLHFEGINDVDTSWLDDVAAQTLTGRSLILIGPSEPGPDTRGLLLDFVKGGGGLICCAPGENFAEAIGLKPRRQGVVNARMNIQLEGFPDTGLPIKGWSQQYGAGTTEPVLTVPLLDGENAAAGDSAVYHLTYGAGHLIVLCYDVAACVYLLRQGDPMLSGCRSSGFERMRPSDLFESWQEEQDAAWPVADLHCHFLRELVHRAWPRETVLPWLWYFPGMADTVLTFTSDDDWSTRDQFERLISACEKHDAGLTFYLVQERSAMDRPWLEDLAARGFDFSIHPDLPPPTQPLWEERLASHVRQFRDTYGRPPSGSIRNHCITWSGYLEGVRIQARHGFTFDTNYFSLLPQGKYYMTGSGLPMRFSDLKGDLLPMFQLPTQFSDETTLGGQGFEWSLDFTPEQAIECVTGLMKQNAAGTHSMMCVNAHPVSFATYSDVLWEPVLKYAQASGTPVWDVDRFSRFWQARRSIRLRPVPQGVKPDFTDLESDQEGISVMMPDSEAAGGRVVCGREFRQEMI